LDKKLYDSNHRLKLSVGTPIGKSKEDSETPSQSLDDGENFTDTDLDYNRAIQKAEQLKQYHMSSFYTPSKIDLKYALESQAELRSSKVFEPETEYYVPEAPPLQIPSSPSSPSTEELPPKMIDTEIESQNYITNGEELSEEFIPKISPIPIEIDSEDTTEVPSESSGDKKSLDKKSQEEEIECEEPSEEISREISRARLVELSSEEDEGSKIIIKLDSDDDSPPPLPEPAILSIYNTQTLLSGSGDTVLVTKFNIEIKRSDLIRLQPNGLLNDEIVNFYMGLLKSREDRNTELPRCHFFNSFFYDKLSKIRTGYDFSSVERWTKSIDLFSFDKIIIPIHKGNHWCIGVIDLKTKLFSYYDSLGSVDQTCIDRLRSYIVDEHKSKKKSKLDISAWKDYCPGHNIPLQYNGVDCGVFACKYADYVAQDKPFNFSQKDIPKIRKKMIEEIYRGELDD